MEQRVRNEYLVFGRPDIAEEDIAEVVAALRSGWIGTGPRTSRFEAVFADYVESPHAVALGSCTAGLQLALRLADVGPGDEVLVPSLTFVATANAVVHAGATPVLCDVDPDTGNLALEDAARRITPNTRAVVPVHYAGRACDMDRLTELVAANDLVMIEDCAHAIETRWHGRHAGTFGLAGAFSFYVTKNVVTGEGGMLTTADGAVAERAKRLALHGLSADAWSRFSDRGYRHYEVVEPGFKMNMTDLQAALGLGQLARVEANLATRQRLWETYDNLLDGLPLTRPAAEEPDSRHARHLYSVLIDPSFDRDEVMGSLHRMGIGTGVHYRAVHLHRFYAERYGYRPRDLPNAWDISQRTLSLPIGPSVSEADVADVADALKIALA